MRLEKKYLSKKNWAKRKRTSSDETTQFIANAENILQRNIECNNDVINTTFVKKSSLEILHNNRRVSSIKRLIICFVVFMITISCVVIIFFDSLRRHQKSLRSKSEKLLAYPANLEVSLGGIKEWCRDDTESSDICSCDDPLLPSVPNDNRVDWWMDAHNANKDLVKASLSEDLGLVFLGDSITERWIGHRHGVFDERYSDNLKIFNRFFSILGGGELNAIALGISGDTSSNLLWRIKNGEVPTDLNPRVWWILIGINDLMFHMCGEDVVVIGFINIVEEILKLKPEAIVVLNGLLPSTEDREGGYDETTYLVFSINQRLKNYASTKERVYYFDPKPLFIEHYRRRGYSKNYVSLTKMPDLLHPSALGYDGWAVSITETLHTIGALTS